MEQFSLPIASFDRSLLPEGARDPASPAFRDAVVEFFRSQFRDLGAQGEIVVTADQIRVTWVTPDFKPLDAALAKLRRGQLRDGILLLELIRSRRPDDVDVLYNLGVARSEAGEPAKAIPLLRRLLELDPSHIRGWVGLGVALGRMGDSQGAEEAFRAAVNADPTDPWAQKNLGGILIRQGLPAEARPHLESALKASPRDAHAWFLLGQASAQSGDPATARAAYHQARQNDLNGPIGERAEQALNRLAGDPLPRNADGVNPEALAAMIAALRRLRSLSPQAAKELTLKAALIGQHGLRLTDPTKVHQIDGIAESLTGLEVACLIHAGVQLASPGVDSGLPLQKEFAAAAARTT